MQQPGQPTPFIRHLRGHLRTSTLVVAFVALGVTLYALQQEQPVEWRVLGLVVVGMYLSAVLNALYDGWKEKRRGAKR